MISTVPVSWGQVGQTDISRRLRPTNHKYSEPRIQLAQGHNGVQPRICGMFHAGYTTDVVTGNMVAQVFLKVPMSLSSRPGQAV